MLIIYCNYVINMIISYSNCDVDSRTRPNLVTLGLYHLASVALAAWMDLTLPENEKHPRVQRRFLSAIESRGLFLEMSGVCLSELSLLGLSLGEYLF